jgi:hypothetical protein
LSGHLADLAEGDYRFAFRSNHLWLSRQEDKGHCYRGQGGDWPKSMALKPSSTSSAASSAFVVQQEGVHHFTMGSDITVFIDPDHLYAYNTQPADW